jgi:hypothetical protein
LQSLDDMLLDQLIARLLTAEELESQAIEDYDSRRQNRLADERLRIHAEIKSRGRAGRAALEELLTSPAPEVRLTAAIATYAWNKDKAIPVIEDLLRWAEQAGPASVERPAVLTTIALSSEVFLADHYGISITDVVPKVTGVRKPQNRDVG